MILIGVAVAQANAVIQAIHTLAQQGVGPGRGRFAIENISQQSMSVGIDFVQEAKQQDMTLSFLTPTLLKQDNQHLKQAPCFSLLLKRILWRTEQFLQTLPNPVELPNDLRRQLIQQATHVTIESSVLEWHNTPRYSARQKAWMPFGGLCGKVHYLNVPNILLPWLQLSEWLHLGNKTTFGHGRIAIQSTYQE